MTIRKISLSEFISDVNTAKLTKDELAEKYGLPKTEIGRILKKYDLKIARKKHQTYELVEDFPRGENLQEAPSVNPPDITSSNDQELPVSVETGERSHI